MEPIVPSPPVPKLNPEQEEAVKLFFDFLLNEEPEMILSGAAGTGKTFTMGKMIDEIMPKYASLCQLLGIPQIYSGVMMTATTNKAAEVLMRATKRPAQTVHSFMNLRVFNDYDTGQTRIGRSKNWKVHSNMILFVDEYSMIDHELHQLILKGVIKSKIVYVGDHCQLSPIGEKTSPVNRTNAPRAVLTRPMRNGAQPALVNLCTQLRATVETGNFKPIKIVPGVIDHVGDEEMEALIEERFKSNDTQDKILGYTNYRVNEYNTHIRSLRGLGNLFTVGEQLVNNSAVQIPRGKVVDKLYTEEEVEVISVSPDLEVIVLEHNGSMEVQVMQVRTRLGAVVSNVKVPTDKIHYNQLLKYYGNKKEWKQYFDLKEQFADLRPKDASTVHKAQGSTHNTVFVDLTDLSSCRDPAVAARLLYVALSRATDRIILYGELSTKFGGLIR